MGVLHLRVFGDADVPIGDPGNPTKVKEEPLSWRGFPRQQMIESRELITVTDTQSALIHLM